MKQLLLLLTLFSACNKQVEVSPTDGELTKLNQSYGPLGLQTMDIYLPAGRSPGKTKSIVLIHGGGWTTGDKNELTQSIVAIKQLLPGYAIFNINYRLSDNGKNIFPSQELDVKAAIEYIFDQRNEYMISDKLAILGVSAGAHLALLQGYKYTSPLKIKAIIDFFGPSDMTAMYNSPASPQITSSMISMIVGATPTSNPTLYFQSSPINYVTPASPPTMILQGGLDQLVAPSQSIALRDMLVSKGVPVQYEFYPNEGHGWLGPTLTDSFNKIREFLTIYMD